MSPAHDPQTTIFPAPPVLAALLAEWMPRQRWYTGKGAQPELVIEGFLDVGRDIRDYLVRDAASPARTLYQVPLSAYRLDKPAGLPEVPEAAIVGEASGVRVVDGAQDARAANALIDVVLRERQLTGGSCGKLATGVDPTEGQGHLTKRRGSLKYPQRIDDVLDARIIRGEQSNSSLIFTTAGPEPDVIGKIFRMIHPGINPEVELQVALAAAGCDHVPAPLGDITATWLDEDGEDVRGHLFFAQEFVAGARDAWRVAVDAAAAGESFAERAYALGQTTAMMHATLAEVMPSWPAQEEDYDAQVDRWDFRLSQATEIVPELARFEDAIRDIYDAALDTDWPELQRIHGDYHLGQVLDVPGRGWILLDFEGEPLRPLSERNEPDLATRDIAGMLRSFDYAAGSVAQDNPKRAEEVAAWAVQARAAFLRGYAEDMPPVSNPHNHAALLDALELDKALYEVVYEARYRPDWINIPLGGIRRILHGA